jgi:Arc/MetJ family transcription regulator
VKLSISVPDTDVAVLDEYARATGLKSRSAAVHHAIRRLRDTDLGDDYATAWEEWESSGDREAWEGTTSDGLVDEAR